LVIQQQVCAMFRIIGFWVVLLASTGLARAAIGINGGPCQYNNFPSAIAAASAGDTLFIEPGNYISFIGVIDKNLTFKPAQSGAPDFTGCEAELTSNENDVITVNGNGASHDAEGGLGKITNGAFVTMYNMTLHNTTATNGGILAVLEGSRLTLRFTTLKDGSASQNGGLIWVSGSPQDPSELYLHGGSQLIDGHSDQYGGAVALNEAEMTSYGGQFGGTDQSGGSDAGISGGVIYALNSSLTLYNGAYVGYSEATVNGGGIYAVDSTLLLSTSTRINYNTAQASGGGIYQINGHTLMSSNAEVRGNTSAGQLTEHGGGGIDLTGTAELVIEDGLVGYNLANGNGGGIRGNDQSMIQLDNEAQVNGNASFSDGGGLAVGNSAVVSGAEIDDNTSYGLGGGLACLSCQSLTINGAANITNNDAENGGGLGLHLANGVVADVQGLTLAGNKADFFGGGNGGGVFLDSGNLHMSGVQIINNEAFDNGGGVYVYRANGFAVDDVLLSSALVANNVTTGSSTNEGGAGLYASRIGLLSLQGVSVSTNDSNNIGGGMYVTFTDDIEIINSVFTANQGSLGGGAYLTSDQLRIDNSEFSNNTGTNSGGGVYTTSGDVLVTRSSFTNNTGRNGGGIYSNSRSLMLLNSHVLNNQATHNGGGVYARRADLIITAAHGTGSFLCDAQSLLFNQYCSTLSGNQAGELGGGIYATTQPDGTNTLLQLADTELASNQAVLGGSAMHVDYPNDARVEVSNALFHHNGSGVDQETLLELNVLEGVSLVGNTVAQNQGQPFVLDTPGLEAVLRNNIIHNNDQGPYISFSVLLDEQCNLSQAPEAGSQSTGANLGDPLFTSSARGPYRLSASSPAVDACTTGPDDDLEGQLRPGGNALYDLGAFEMDGAGSEELIFKSGFQW
jgi:predicted outer membrane repeat protein